VNVKASWLPDNRSFSRARVISRPFEIWRDKNMLAQVLLLAHGALRAETAPEAMAVTMTAELSDAFAAKREGVLFVTGCIRDCFPDSRIYFLNVSGDFLTAEEARADPLALASSNWMASARWAARKHRDCLLVDVGSTTTDIIPILGGKVCAAGRTDTARLQTGELVYTGVLRTNLAAIVQSVPIGGRSCRVSSEYFAVSGDVHLILGHIQPGDYTCPTPDDRPPTVDASRGRLARLVCADTEMLSESDMDALAHHIHEQQILQIRSGMEQVIAAIPELRRHPVAVHGTGAFLGSEAARSLGLGIRAGGDDLNPGQSATLPCLAVAWLLGAKLRGEP
jgi:probable H4MPT-linked C1 transfer pathway protein